MRNPSLLRRRSLSSTAWWAEPWNLDTYQIPDVVRKPVNDRINTADKLQMFGFGRSLGNKKHDETGRYKGHGDNNKDGNHKICALTPGRDEKETNGCVLLMNNGSVTRLNNSR